MSFLEELFSHYGIWAMLVLILLEYACFPVSSEIVLPLAGAFAASMRYPFLLIVPLSVCAGLIGTYLCYYLGLIGGQPILHKLTTRYPKASGGIQRSKDYFEKYGPYTVGVLRMVPLCRTYIAFVAGALKMDCMSFLFSSLLGITLWNTLLIGAGYKLGQHWSAVGQWYSTYKGILVPAVILGILTIVSLRIVFRKRE